MAMRQCSQFEANTSFFFSFFSFCNKIQKCTPNCQCSFISSGTNLNNSFIFNQTTVLFYHVLPTLTANCSFTLRTQERTLLTEHRDIISNVSALPVAESTHWEKCNFISPSCLSQQPVVQTFKWVGKPTTVVKVPILGLVYTIHRPATSSYTVLITIIYLSIKMTQIKQTHDKNLFSTTVHQVLLADRSSSLLSWITLFTQSQLEKPQVIGVSGESIKRFVNTAKKKKKPVSKTRLCDAFRSDGNLWWCFFFGSGWCASAWCKAAQGWLWMCRRSSWALSRRSGLLSDCSVDRERCSCSRLFTDTQSHCSLSDNGAHTHTHTRNTNKCFNQ